MKRNKFSLSHYKLMSANMGTLYPVGLVEVLPGDTIQHSTSVLTRVSPLLAPVMHPVDVRIHHWFVPHRLIWRDWEDFITGGSDGMDASVFPTISLASPGSADVGKLNDYLGGPVDVNAFEVSALPFRAYQTIYNEWYRDEDLGVVIAVPVSSGPDATTSTDLRTIAWEKDYFTSARPWTQKGPEVTIPLSGDAPVVTDVATGADIGVYSTANAAYRLQGADAAVVRLSGTGSTEAASLYADLSDVNAANVNDLRLAFALQRYEEARARYGSRYTEYLRYLGVRSSDARLQRPEYLGGGKQTLQFSEVLQTAEGTDPVGELRGHGIGALRSNKYRRFFEEHGYVISLLSVRPKTIYTQGSPRTLNRRTKEDFWQRELEHIGQQEVLNKEVYAAHTTPDGVFGYQDRYDEYRRQESHVSGEFRTTALDFWHMGRVFSSDPALNSSFVNCNPTTRIYASTATDVLWMMVNHSIQARRQLSKIGKSYIF